MSETKTYYRPSLRFKAKDKALCHQECCFKGAEEVRNADGTLRTEAIRPLWAEFGTYGSEYQPVDEHGDPINDMFDGHSLVFADIRGGFFDLDVQADEKGWTDSEKEIVARHMLTMLGKPQCEFTLLEPSKVAAPWPTYDSTHHKQIAPTAKITGTVAQAIAYESQNRKRDGVLADLREALNAPVVADDESLVAA